MRFFSKKEDNNTLFSFNSLKHTPESITEVEIDVHWNPYNIWTRFCGASVVEMHCFTQQIP